MQDIKSDRIRIVSKEDYGVDLEYNEMFAILHFPYMKKFDRGIYTDFQITLPEIAKFVDTVGYEGLWAAVDEEDTFINKIANRFGFTKIGAADGLNVYEYIGEI